MPGKHLTLLFHWGGGWGGFFHHLCPCCNVTSEKPCLTLQSKVSFISHSAYLKLWCFTLSYSQCPLCPEQCLALSRSSINICGRHECFIPSSLMLVSIRTGIWTQVPLALGVLTLLHLPTVFHFVTSCTELSQYCTVCDTSSLWTRPLLSYVHLFSFLHPCFSSCLLWDPTAVCSIRCFESCLALCSTWHWLIRGCVCNLQT